MTKPGSLPSPPARDESAFESSRKGEERYRTLFEYAPDGVLIADRESVYIDANSSICRMLGYSREELIGLHASDIVAPEEIPRIDPTLDEIKSNCDYSKEWRFLRKDRSTFHAEVMVTVMPDGNLLAMIRDITERKGAELVLREKEMQLHAADRKLAQIMHGMAEACFALDPEWCFTFVNDSGEELLRHSREEMLGRSFWEVFHQLLGTPQEAYYRLAMSERAPVTFEVLSPIAGRWLEIRLFHTGDGLAAFLMDITERKKFESALRESELRFGTAFRSSPAAIAINRRRDLNILEVNTAFLRLFECTSDEMVGHSISEVSIFSAETVMSLRAQLDATGMVEDQEVPARSRLGKKLELNLSVRTIELGGEACSLSTIVDITARKKAMQETRDQLDELLRWQDLMLNREERVQELKHEVNELLRREGRPERYEKLAHP